MDEKVQAEGEARKEGWLGPWGFEGYEERMEGSHAPPLQVDDACFLLVNAIERVYSYAVNHLECILICMCMRMRMRMRLCVSTFARALACIGVSV